VRLTAAIVATAIGFVATVAAPPGPPLLLAMSVFVVGGIALADLAIVRWMP